MDVRKLSTGRPKTHVCADGKPCKKCRDNAARRNKYNADNEWKEQVKTKVKQYRLRNKEKVNAADRERWRTNEVRRALSRISHNKNYSKDLGASREYGRNKYHRNKHRGTYTASAAKRRARKLKATPKWLNEEQLNKMTALYRQAKLTGTHVDHIVPLQGVEVCGLHVPWNLQLLEPSLNLSKGNKLDE